MTLAKGRLAIKDVRTAFLQSNKFPADVVKYISFKDPVTKVIESPIHVDTKDNLADMFTKILSEKDFVRLRSKLMYELKE